MKKCTLLIVDRHLYIRYFLKRELSKAGYDVALAANARQTLEWLGSRKPPGLLVLDPDLPDTEGLLVSKSAGTVSNG